IPLFWLVKRELIIGIVPAAVVAGLHAAGWKIHDFAGLTLHAATYLAIAAGTAIVVSGDLVREVWRAVRAKADGEPPPDGHAGPVVLVATPRPMAFPLLVAAAVAGARLWVTSRDWPAVGRLDLDTDTS